MAISDLDALRAHLAEHGMYRPEYESDACGIGVAVWPSRGGRDVAERIHAYLRAQAVPAREAA